MRSPLQRRPVSGNRAPKNLRLLAKPTKRASAESSVLSPVPDRRRPPRGANASGKAATSEHRPRSSRQTPTPGSHDPNICRFYVRGSLPREWNSARKSGAISTDSPGAFCDGPRSNHEPPLKNRAESSDGCSKVNGPPLPAPKVTEVQTLWKSLRLSRATKLPLQARPQASDLRSKVSGPQSGGGSSLLPLDPRTPARFLA